MVSVSCGVVVEEGFGESRDEKARLGLRKWWFLWWMKIVLRSFMVM